MEPKEVHVPSVEERVRVTVGPNNPAEQYQAYDVELATGDGLIAFV